MAFQVFLNCLVVVLVGWAAFQARRFKENKQLFCNLKELSETIRSAMNKADADYLHLRARVEKLEKAARVEKTEKKPKKARTEIFMT